jgi:hypothetical protein
MKKSFSGASLLGKSAFGTSLGQSAFVKSLSISILVLLLTSIFLSGCAGNNAPLTPEQAKNVKIAKCLTDKGAKFYGSYTCPHCNDEKEAFGKAALEYLPYVECNPNGKNSQSDKCIEEKVEAYPTWIFADTYRKVGFTEITELQQISGCSDEALKKYALPGEAAEEPSSVQDSAAANPSAQPPTPATLPSPAPVATAPASN